MSARSGALLAALALGLVSSGCGQKKSEECTALVKVINEGVQALERQDKAEGDAAGLVALKAMADVLDKIAGDAARLTLATRELTAFSGEYQSMAREVSRSAREMVVAAEAKDETKMTSAQATMGVAEQNAFSGSALGTKWSDPNKRSAFFGSFAY